MTVAATRRRDDFDSFYQVNFGDTVALAYSYTTDLAEAQDIAQEAFCRAWQRWAHVSTYDNPVAWVRRVAFNLAHSRWRRLKVAATHIRKQRIDEVPGLNPDHVAVVAALRKLPKAQREAIVLHHIADVPVDEVARQLDVPVGTVKSWLHRGRAALAGELSIDVQRHVKTPPASEVVALAKRQQRVRTATVATVIAALVAGALVAVQLFRPRESPPPITPTPPPSASPSPSPSMDPNDPMRSVAWATSTVAFSAPREDCPSGQVTFRPTEFEGNSGPAQSWPKATFLTSRVAVGDLTGDGRAEAALIVTCRLNVDSDDSSSHLLVVSRRDDGTLHALGWAGRQSSGYSGTWISDGVLYIDARPHESSQAWEYKPGQVDGYRWTGNAFEIVSTADRYPIIVGEFDLLAMASQLRCRGLAPRANPTLSFDASGKAVDGDRVWSLKPGTANWPPASPIWLRANEAASPDLLLHIGCKPSNSSADFAVTLVIVTRSQGKWVATGAGITSASAGGSVRVTSVQGSAVSVDDAPTGNDPHVVDYTWTGREFVR